MTNDEMATTHAKLTEIAALTLEVEHLPEYIDRIRNAAPVADSRDHVDLALAIAAVQNVAHRQLDPTDAAAE